MIRRLQDCATDTQTAQGQPVHEQLMLIDRAGKYHRHLLNFEYNDKDEIEVNLVPAIEHDCSGDKPPTASIYPGTLFMMTYDEECQKAKEKEAQTNSRPS